MSTPCTPTPWRGSEHESEHRIESMTSLESPLRHTVESDTEGEIMSHRDSRGESFLLKRASAPKILLEVLSPGGTRLLFLVMYASCALAIWRYNSARTAAEARHEARASVAVEPLGDGVPASVGSRAVWVDFCLPVDAAAYDGACHVVQPRSRSFAAGGQFRAAYSGVDSLDTSGEAIARVALLGIWAVIAAAWLPYGLGQIRRRAAAAATAAPRLVAGRRGGATCCGATGSSSRPPRTAASRSRFAMRFPTLWGVDRAPTLALASWPVDALRAFVACSLGIVLAMFLWGALFAFLLALAGDRLNRTPYVLSRRHQLSYRDFMLQATLVAGIGVASYYHLGVELFHGYRRNLLVLAKGQRHNEVQFTSALQDLAGALEALVADDVRDLASAFCFTVYVALILYLHLPPPAERSAPDSERSRPSVAAQLLPRQVLEDLGELGNLSGVLVGARFAVDERADRKRRRQIRKRTGRAAEPVFVVETASWLAKVSVESYYDVAPKGDADAGTAAPPARGLARSVAGGGGGRAAAGPLHAALHAAGAAPAVRDARAEATPAEDGDLGDDDDEAGASREAKGPMDWFLRSAAVLFGGVERGVVAAERPRAWARVGAADVIPELETFVHPCVHNGFWRAYAGVRPRLLAAVAKALDGEPLCRVLCCGHSLGGALAQVAAADLATHCLPQRRKQTRLSCYTFGSPRVGNHIWARTFDALVPDAYRVVADGDVVPAVPRCCFRHGGTPVVVDPKARAAGFLIVDPSFIEQSLALSYSRKLAPRARATSGASGAAGAYGDAPPDALLDAPTRPTTPSNTRALPLLAASAAAAAGRPDPTPSSTRTGRRRPETQAEVREIDRARYKAAAGAAPAKTASFLDGVPLEAPDANMPRPRYARDARDSE
ncbi:phospholipase [Aureococcus anophagefferens]|nr:phospholipase [Aureococcus anophagefferens]